MGLQIRSRILEFLPKDCLFELDAVRRDRFAKHNNDKVDKIIKILNEYEIEYTPLGPGTNRYAILIDGYVIKIALDNDGVNDNWQEFALSAELQPYVIKVYECNGTFMSCEYITLISKEEFVEGRDEIQDILSRVSQQYLIGDVGTITKNYLNWGFRDDGNLVILDFAYFFEISPELMRCGALIDKNTGRLCEGLLEYDHNFNDLVCPSCRKTYISALIRSRITQEDRLRYTEIAKGMAYKVTNAVTPVYENENVKEENIMRNRYEIEEAIEPQLTEEEEEELREQSFAEMLQKLNSNKFTIEELDGDRLIYDDIDEEEEEYDIEEGVSIDRVDLDIIVENALPDDVDPDDENLYIEELEEDEARKYLDEVTKDIMVDEEVDDDINNVISSIDIVVHEEDITPEVIEVESPVIENVVDDSIEEVVEIKIDDSCMTIEEVIESPPNIELDIVIEEEIELPQVDHSIEVEEIDRELSESELDDLLSGMTDLEMTDFEEDEYSKKSELNDVNLDKSFVLELPPL